jgi:mRNA interferase HigB
VRVISRKPLREFWRRHADVEGALRLWHKTALAAHWGSLKDVRQTYAHADAVRTAAGDLLTAFNVGGNKHRLIARNRYDFRLINIRAVLTHKEYNEGPWKE